MAFERHLEEAIITSRTSFHMTSLRRRKDVMFTTYDELTSFGQFKTSLRRQSAILEVVWASLRLSCLTFVHATLL